MNNKLLSILVVSNLVITIAFMAYVYIAVIKPTQNFFGSKTYGDMQGWMFQENEDLAQWVEESNEDMVASHAAYTKDLQDYVTKENQGIRDDVNKGFDEISNYVDKENEDTKTYLNNIQTWMDEQFKKSNEIR